MARSAVVDRKVWGANRSDAGAQTQGRLMTFLRTAHQQGADAVNLLVDLAWACDPGVPSAGIMLTIPDTPRGWLSSVHANGVGLGGGAGG